MVFSTPAFFAAIFARTDAAQRGVAASTATAFIDVGVAAGPIALGFGAQARGIPFAFALAAVVALLGSVWAVWLARPRMPVVVSSTSRMTPATPPMTTTRASAKRAAARPIFCSRPMPSDQPSGFAASRTRSRPSPARKV